MSNAVTVDLPENLTIANAESLYSELDQYINGSKDVVFSANDVARADTAGLQLIYVFMKTLKEREAEVSWSSPSSALIEASEQLGLKVHLGLIV